MQLSTGTLIHIDALGPQDEFLSALPGTGQTKPPSHFRQCIRRHSRFALDVKEEEFPNGFFFGSLNRMELGRRGDMLGDITLEIRLPIIDGASPSDTWIDGIGHVLLRRLNLIVDDTLVQTQERLWYDLSDKMFLSAAHANGKNEMIGKGHVLSLTKSHIIYVPLKLLSCKSHHKNQVFLPLLSVPGSTISLTFECESFENCVTSYSGSQPPMSLDVRLLVEYVFLDSAEKERILRRPTTIMFEDVQDMESRSYTESNSTDGAFRIPLDRVDVDLSELNVPVKALVWVTYATNYGQFFEYTDDIAETTLLLSGRERIEPRTSEYFKRIDPYMHNFKIDTGNVHLYSLSLDVGGMQPSGHLSFDQVHAPLLRVFLKEKRSDLTVKVFAMCYKMLVVDRGRLSMKFV
jgi:hypothetical protein